MSFFNPPHTFYSVAREATYLAVEYIFKGIVKFPLWLEFGLIARPFYWLFSKLTGGYIDEDRLRGNYHGIPVIRDVLTDHAMWLLEFHRNNGIDLNHLRVSQGGAYFTLLEWVIEKCSRENTTDPQRRAKHLAIVQKLLDLGVDPNGYNHGTVHTNAVYEGVLYIADYLRARGAVISDQAIFFHNFDDAAYRRMTENGYKVRMYIDANASLYTLKHQMFYYNNLPNFAREVVNSTLNPNSLEDLVESVHIFLRIQMRRINAGIKMLLPTDLWSKIFSFAFAPKNSNSLELAETNQRGRELFNLALKRLGKDANKLLHNAVVAKNDAQARYILTKYFTEQERATRSFDMLDRDTRKSTVDYANEMPDNEVKRLMLGNPLK